MGELAGHTRAGGFIHPRQLHHQGGCNDADSFEAQG